MWHSIDICRQSCYTDNNLKKNRIFYRTIPHLNILWNCHNFHSDQVCLCFSTCLHMHSPRASWLKWKPVCGLMRSFSSQWTILLLISFSLPHRQNFIHLKWGRLSLFMCLSVSILWGGRGKYMSRLYSEQEARKGENIEKL